MVSERLKQFPPFYAMEILGKAKELQRKGEDIIRLEIGEPDFKTSDNIVQAGIKALQEGKTKYTSSLGLIELRQAICDYYKRKYNVDITPDRIVICNGTSHAMFLMFSSLIEQGDEVLMSDPHYACYPNFTSFFNSTPIYSNVNGEDGFQYNVEDFQSKLTAKTKSIMINSPSNPTGAVQSKQTIRALTEISKLPIISDEIYQGISYGEKDHSTLEFTENAFIMNGFSKLYAMTGWRLGYLIAPKEYIRPIEKLQQNFFLCANTFVQWAGIEALNGPQDQIKEMVDTYNKRRKFIVPRLNEMGFKVKKEPEGAYYVLADCKEFSNDSLSFAEEILKNAKVSVTPGIDFGQNAEGHIRFSYSNSIENIKEGMNRLESFLKNRK
jgi:(5-formylfuran-3-yl)methyl phosphate transaminase